MPGLVQFQLPVGLMGLFVAGLSRKGGGKEGGRETWVSHRLPYCRLKKHKDDKKMALAYTINAAYNEVAILGLGK